MTGGKCRVSPVLTSGMLTPPDCSVVGTKAFQPQPQVRIRMTLTKSIHKAHKSIFYPGSGRPLANDPTSCFGGLFWGGSELQWMILSGYQEAAFSSFYTSRPFSSLASLSTPVTDEVAAVCLSFSTSCLRMALLLSLSLVLNSPLLLFLPLLYYADSASFYTVRGHHNGY